MYLGAFVFFPEYIEKICPHFDLLEQIFGTRKNVTLPAIYESGAEAMFDDIGASSSIIEESYEDDDNIIYDPDPKNSSVVVHEQPANETEVATSKQHANTTAEASTSSVRTKKGVQKRTTQTLVDYLTSSQEGKLEIEKEKLVIERKRLAIEEQRFEAEREKMQGELRLRELEIERKFELEKYELDLKYKYNNQ